MKVSRFYFFSPPKWTGDLLVIVEYCCYGNLQNYLIRNRNRFVNQVDDHGYMNPSIGAEQLAEAAAMYVNA